MRFLVDECTGPAVARWLRTQSYDVCSIYDEHPGMSDIEVVAKAFHEHRILITSDKDFGEMVYRDQQPHHGVILLRLRDERTAEKIAAVERVLLEHQRHHDPMQLVDAFVVVTERHIRVKLS